LTKLFLSVILIWDITFGGDVVMFKAEFRRRLLAAADIVRPHYVDRGVRGLVIGYALEDVGLRPKSGKNTEWLAELMRATINIAAHAVDDSSFSSEREEWVNLAWRRHSRLGWKKGIVGRFFQPVFIYI
jgi:hypothetical protein